MSWEKKKRIPDFDHTYCVQGLNITTSQNSITENGNRLNSLYWYKAIVRCTHLVARILQHGCKFSSWLKVNKISNQTVHHQSATKCDSMLQDIKRLQACKAENTFCISDIAQKNKITNIFKCRHRKKLQLGKQNVKTNKWLGNLCKAVKTKPWPKCFSLSHFFALSARLWCEKRNFAF